jgi:hypothetical protein
MASSKRAALSDRDNPFQFPPSLDAAMKTDGPAILFPRGDFDRRAGISIDARRYGSLEALMNLQLMGCKENQMPRWRSRPRYGD